MLHFNFPATINAVAGGPKIPKFRPFASNSPRKPLIATVFGVETSVKPKICTADELHYVPVPGTDWKLALWRYKPSNEAPERNHPLMLLSGLATNAIGFDLSPEASFARHMCTQGFDTWIVEVRGSGLSMRKDKSGRSLTDPFVSDMNSVHNGVLTVDNESKGSYNSRHQLDIYETKLVSELNTTFVSVAERLSGYLNENQLRDFSAGFVKRISKLLEDNLFSKRLDEITDNISGLLESRQNSAVPGQIRVLSQRLVNLMGEGQRSTLPQLFDLHERLLTTIDDFQKHLDLITTYNWDFDHYLEEDIPAAMEYIKLQTKSKDEKMLAIGHSMGGILLYAMLSKCAYEGKSSGLAAAATLASSIDYRPSKSSLKSILPLADTAQVLNVPVIPVGALLAAAYPLSSRPPYVLSWLNDQISAHGMMHPEFFRRLILNNFCTVPAKLLLQLTSVFQEGGLRDRSGTFFYKDHLHKCKVPVLAVAGDLDRICPPEAVYDTVKVFPEELVSYKLFGKPEGPHYAHYDIVDGRLMVDEVYPCIIEFLTQHDDLPSSYQIDNTN